MSFPYPLLPHQHTTVSCEKHKKMLHTIKQVSCMFFSARFSMKETLLVPQSDCRCALSRAISLLSSAPPLRGVGKLWDAKRLTTSKSTIKKHFITSCKKEVGQQTIFHFHCQHGVIHKNMIQWPWRYNLSFKTILAQEWAVNCSKYRNTFYDPPYYTQGREIFHFINNMVL